MPFPKATLPPVPCAPQAEIDLRTLAFDIDGVVADTMQLFLDIAREDFGIRHVRYSDITHYNLEDCLDLPPAIIAAIIEQILAGTHRPVLQPIADSPVVLNQLGARAGPLLFVTARPEAEVIARWLQQTLQLPPKHITVVATGSFEAKADVLKDAGVRTFVEDRLETCYQLQDAGITPLLFKQPWNRHRHPFEEIDTWRNLARRLGS
jgi:uncharacterized HAD superfamily protein